MGGFSRFGCIGWSSFWGRCGLFGLFALLTVSGEAQSQNLQLTRRLEGVNAAPVGVSAKAFSTWLNPAMVSRSFSLADLGLTQPVSLDLSNSSQTFFFPALVGLELRDIHWRLDHRFFSDDADAKMSAHLAGEPVHWGDLGPAGAVRTVDGDLTQLRSASSFVPLRIAFSSSTALASPNLPSDCRANVNAFANLQVQPSTQLTYRFGSVQLKTPADAWAVMPSKTVILVSGRSLEMSAYEAAWKLGSSVANSGRRPEFESLPKVGQQVVVDGLNPPINLLTLPAFAAFASKRAVVLQSNAEVLAWFLLRMRQDSGVQMVIADASFYDVIKKGGEQVLQQILEKMPNAEVQWQELMSIWQMPATTEHDGKAARLLPSPAGPVIVLLPSQLSGLGDLLGAGKRLPEKPGMFSGSLALSMTELGADIGTFAVGDQASWRTIFRAADAALAGNTPQELVLDVQMPAVKDSVDPVLSVHINDVLLTAIRLSTGESAERIKIKIPSYLLKVRNDVRVVVQRQTAKYDCTNSLLPQPFSILPSSHWVVGGNGDPSTMGALAAGLANEGELRIGPDELTRATDTLPRLVWLTHALGVVPTRMKLIVESEPAVHAHTTVSHLKLVSATGSMSSGLFRLTRDVSAGVPSAAVTWLGLLPAGGWPKVPDWAGKSMLVDPDGRVREVDGAQVWGETFSSEVREPWLKRQMGWLVPFGFVLAFVGLLIAANRRRRRLES